jgi:hypothetical protein
MPDPYGFDHLGANVRCIDCPTGGPVWRWPEQKRQRYARSHGRQPTTPRRSPDLLALPSPLTSEEKEAITMATTNSSSSSKQPAKQVAIDVLRKADGPLHTSEIVKRVLATGKTQLKGKTPEATISAMLAVGSKPGGPFSRVDKGTYTLADASGTQTTKAKTATAPPRKRRAAKSKPRKTRTTTRRAAKA